MGVGEGEGEGGHGAGCGDEAVGGVVGVVARAAPRPEEQPVMNQTGASSIVVAGDIAGKISRS